jgi:hypothetical protein
MRKTLVSLLFVALLATPQIVRAEHYSDTYVISTAAHTTGAFSTFFLTDVAIQNFQSSPLVVQFAFIETGGGDPENISPLINPAAGLTDGSITVPPGGNVVIRDILNGFEGRTDGILGALLLFSDLPFAVTSRSYNSRPDGGTVGIGIPPARDFFTESVGLTDLSMATAYLPGLSVNSQYRSNIGFVASSLGTTPLLVEVTINNETGPIANGTRTFGIPPGSIIHLQFSTRDVVNSTFDAGSATLRIVGGSGAVIPYAAVTDNISADAVYISGVFPRNAASAGTTGKSSLRSVFGRALFR